MGSYMFFAPEMFQRENSEIQIKGELTDLWALGITLFYITSGRYPCWDAKNVIHLKELICEREINFEMVKHAGIRNLLQKMLHTDTEKRASLSQILEDPWVTINGSEPVKVTEVE